MFSTTGDYQRATTGSRNVRKTQLLSFGLEFLSESNEIRAVTLIQMTNERIYIGRFFTGDFSHATKIKQNLILICAPDGITGNSKQYSSV